MEGAVVYVEANANKSESRGHTRSWGDKQQPRGERGGVGTANESETKTPFGLYRQWGRTMRSYLLIVSLQHMDIGNFYVWV